GGRRTRERGGSTRAGEGPGARGQSIDSRVRVPRGGGHGAGGRHHSLPPRAPRRSWHGDTRWGPRQPHEKRTGRPDVLKSGALGWGGAWGWDACDALGLLLASSRSAPIPPLPAWRRGGVHSALLDRASTWCLMRDRGSELAVATAGDGRCEVPFRSDSASLRPFWEWVCRPPGRKRPSSRLPSWPVSGGRP